MLLFSPTCVSPSVRRVVVDDQTGRTFTGRPNTFRLDASVLTAAPMFAPGRPTPCARRGAAQVLRHQTLRADTRSLRPGAIRGCHGCSGPQQRTLHEHPPGRANGLVSTTPVLPAGAGRLQTLAPRTSDRWGDPTVTGHRRVPASRPVTTITLAAGSGWAEQTSWAWRGHPRGRTCPANRAGAPFHWRCSPTRRANRPAPG
jgi:hypothetical protein